METWSHWWLVQMEPVLSIHNKVSTPIPYSLVHSLDREFSTQRFSIRKNARIFDNFLIRKNSLSGRGQPGKFLFELSKPIYIWLRLPILQNVFSVFFQLWPVTTRSRMHFSFNDRLLSSYFSAYDISLRREIGETCCTIKDMHQQNAADRSSATSIADWWSAKRALCNLHVTLSIAQFQSNDVFFSYFEWKTSKLADSETYTYGVILV